MNTDRLICGLAVPFGEPAVTGDLEYQRWQFERFAELETALPLLFQHRHEILPSGTVTGFGRAERFALLDAQGEMPAGLLALARVDDTPMGDALLEQIRHGLRDPWSPQSLTGLSFKCEVIDSGAGMAWPLELSVGYQPRFDSARILGVGADAARVWSLLTGTDVRVVA